MPRGALRGIRRGDARVLVVCAGLLFSPGLRSQPAYSYAIEVAPELDALEITACFGDRVPEALVALLPSARQQLLTVETTRGRPLRRPRAEGDRLPLPDLRDGECVHYRVALDDLPRRWRRGAGGLRVGRDLLLSPQLFLWYPLRQGRYEPFELSFVLPEGIQVSAPWRELARSAGRVAYALGGRPYDWAARVALGRFKPVIIPVGRRRMHLTVLDGEPAPDEAALRRWVEVGVRALARVYGHLPVDGAQVLVVPTGPGREPVPWGQVMRGGGDAVQLFIDQTRPLEEFLADWTLYHELSHLLHPRLQGSDRWLSEGLASYYQNVLQARSGAMTPEQAWERLHAGFQRGIRGTPRDLTLAEAAEHMVRDRLFMRVYWSGAAVALLADATLRRQTGGRQSLDTALAGLEDCCLPAPRIWSGRELMGRLDALTGTRIFSRLYREQARSEAFPDLRDLYERLGLVSRQGRLRFDPDAPDAAICEAIMAPARPGP